MYNSSRGRRSMDWQQCFLALTNSSADAIFAEVMQELDSHKFRSGTHALNEELGRHRGRAGKLNVLCVVLSMLHVL